MNIPSNSPAIHIATTARDAFVLAAYGILNLVACILTYPKLICPIFCIAGLFQIIVALGVTKLLHMQKVEKEEFEEFSKLRNIDPDPESMDQLKSMGLVPTHANLTRVGQAIVIAGPVRRDRVLTVTQNGSDVVMVRLDEVIQIVPPT